MSPYQRTILDDVPLAYWRLGELSGTSAADASGNGKTGTYSGTFSLGTAGAIAGDNDPSTKFDGSSGMVSVPAITLLTTWTIEAWVKWNGTQSNDRTIVGAALNSAVIVNYAFNVNITGGPGGGFAVDTGYYNSGWNKTAQTIVTDQTWHHLVGIYDGSNVTLYVDGIAGTPVAASAPITGSAPAVGIASRPGVGLFFNGWIDEVAIYSGALSAARVKAHYNAGITQGKFFDDEDRRVA